MRHPQLPGRVVLSGIAGPARGQVFVLGPDALTVGRRDGMTACIADPKLSSHHADIVCTDGGCLLRDRNSTNGTFVNGEPVVETWLAPHDRIQMGRSEFVLTQMIDTGDAVDQDVPTDTAELISDGADSGLVSPTVQVSVAAQSVQVGTVCGTGQVPETHKLCSLYEVARRITVLSELDSLLELVVATILDEMQADRVVLLLPHAETGSLRPAVTKCRPGLAQGGPVQVSETIVNQVVASRQSILTEDAASDKRFTEGESISLVGIRSAMCVPLLANDKVVGVVYVDKLSQTAAFTAADLEFLTVLCSSAAISIDNARLFSEIQARNREITEAHLRLEASYLELEETQKRLIQAEKLSSLGRLVAGIAHDLKNILTSVTGYAQLLKIPSPDEQRAMYVERLNATTAICTKMVRDLMSFARQDEVTLAPTNLNSLVNEAIGIVSTLSDEAGIEVVRELADPLPAVQLDALQMTRVLTNLLTNAIQAMSGWDGPRRLAVRTAQAGAELHLTVEDTGPGIPSDAIGQIFDPFFTTKPTGTGTGLGLSLCQGIVAAHGGTIEVDSIPGAGARFTLRLPIDGPVCSRCAGSTTTEGQ